MTLTTLTLPVLRELVRTGSALRAITRLQPAGGAGDKVFPSTYAEDKAETKYALETRLIDGTEVRCVLLDSVASQANRMELALLDAIDEGDVQMPLVAVSFQDTPGLQDLAQISSLQAPHRIADALLRDATLDGVMFRTSELGRSFTDSSPSCATPMYSVCPHALLFGIWDSTGPKGGLGSKFQRVLVSEIVGIDVRPGVKTASRLDPASISKNVPLYQSSADDTDWVLDETKAKQAKKKPVKYGKDGKASEANHGNIPPSIDAKAGGVTMDHAQQTTVLSLTGLRQLRFPLDVQGASLSGAKRKKAQLAARTNLAALGLAAITLGWRGGYHLRSRAQLIPELAERLIEAIDGDGHITQYKIDADVATELLRRATAEADDAGMGWNTELVTLEPSNKLAELIRRSRADHTRNKDQD